LLSADIRPKTKTGIRGGHALAAVVGWQLSLLSALLLGVDFKVALKWFYLELRKTLLFLHPQPFA
jgi:hypothetical protein